MKRLREIFPHSNEEPTHFVMTKWFEDENSRGSYSFPAVGGGSRGKIRKERKVEEGERRYRREEYLLFFFFFLLFLIFFLFYFSYFVFICFCRHHQLVRADTDEVRDAASHVCW